MDDFLSRFDRMDHYELLGVAPDADAPTLQRAWSSRRRLYDPSIAPPAQRELFDRAFQAIGAAYAALADPVQRHRYDQARRDAGSAQDLGLSDFTWVAASANPSGPAPRASSPEVKAVTQSDPRVSALSDELGKLIVEIERVAAATHLLVARAVEPGAVRPEALVGAAEALAQSRANLASMLAGRDEAAGRYAQAVTHWQRAARQRPGETGPYVRAANVLRKGAKDFDGAERMAQHALEIDPDCAEAHAELAVIHALRARRAP